jgi:hypothetical protein
MDHAKIKAQVIIEFALSLVVLVVFLLATTRVFVWLADNIAKRHQDYENTRSAPGVAPAVDFYTHKEPLKIFNKENIIAK